MPTIVTRVSAIEEAIQKTRDKLGGRLDNGVCECIAAVLNISPSKVGLQSALIAELGAESIDMLDLTHRLEQMYKITVPVNGWTSIVKEQLGSQFEANGTLTDTALERLRLLMPEVSADTWVQGLRRVDVIEHCTAETYVRLVAWQLSGQPLSSEQQAHGESN